MKFVEMTGVSSTYNFRNLSSSSLGKVSGHEMNNLIFISLFSVCVCALFHVCVCVRFMRGGGMCAKADRESEGFFFEGEYAGPAIDERLQAHGTQRASSSWRTHSSIEASLATFGGSSPDFNSHSLSFLRRCISLA